MAKMIPDAYPTDTASTAERTLFTALETALDDDFTVVHSLPWLDDSRRYLQEGECDFVLLHPYHGMLVVEAKSGEALYDSTRQTWYRSDGSRLNKDPFRQAQESVHRFSRILKRDVAGWSRAAPPFGYAVAFPDADQVKGRFPPHVRPDIVILESDLARLDTRIVDILGTYRQARSRMSADIYERALNRLLPEFHVSRSLSALIRKQASGFFRMTGRQIELMHAMRENRRLLVQGCAGSGKTMLAFEKARQLATGGARVLLLCFNIPLATSLRARAKADAPDLPIDVFHFHGLCEHVARSVGREFHVPAQDAGQFWDVECAELLCECLRDYATRYDAIIVDEGQDFVDCWWIPVEDLLADAGTSHFYIFHDPEQNIFQRSNGYPFAGPRMVLDENCRNTTEIASYVHGLVGSSARSAGHFVEGVPPVEWSVSSDEEERERVSQILQQLIHEQGLAPEQFVILGRHRYENSPYAGARTLGGVAIASEADPAAGPAAVRYATLYRYKGLEADCAIVTGFSRQDDDRRVRELYVATSRARSLLYVLYRG